MLPLPARSGWSRPLLPEEEELGDPDDDDDIDDLLPADLWFRSAARRLSRRGCVPFILSPPGRRPLKAERA